MAIIKHRMKGQGYYLSDNSLSGGRKEEADVWTCWHCQKIIILKDWREDGGWCSRCNGAVCAGCADKMLTEGCSPFLKQIEKLAEEQARRRQLSRVLGLDGE